RPGAPDRGVAVRDLQLGNRNRDLYRRLRRDHPDRHRTDDRLHRQGHFGRVQQALIFSVYRSRRSVDDRHCLRMILFGKPLHTFPGSCANRETTMRRGRILLTALAVLTSAALFNSNSGAQTPADTATTTPDNAVMLTVFLKHDQSRPLAELNAQLEKQGFYKAFPPAGIEVVSWNIVMGVGQVVTLRLPASRLREINRIFETTAWGAYRTEYYATYDYKAIGIANHEKAQ